MSYDGAMSSGLCARGVTPRRCQHGYLDLKRRDLFSVCHENYRWYDRSTVKHLLVTVRDSRLMVVWLTFVSGG